MIMILTQPKRRTSQHPGSCSHSYSWSSSNIYPCKCCSYSTKPCSNMSWTTIHHHAKDIRAGCTTTPAPNTMKPSTPGTRGRPKGEKTWPGWGSSPATMLRTWIGRWLHGCCRSQPAIHPWQPRLTARTLDLSDPKIRLQNQDKSDPATHQTQMNSVLLLNHNKERRRKRGWTRPKSMWQKWKGPSRDLRINSKALPNLSTLPFNQWQPPGTPLGTFVVPCINV